MKLWKYITADRHGNIITVHRWLIGAWLARVDNGGTVYKRECKRPMWWRPLSGVGHCLWYGTLVVAPGYYARGPRSL